MLDVSKIMNYIKQKHPKVFFNLMLNSTIKLVKT